jgi:transposase-like protein
VQSQVQNCPPVTHVIGLFSNENSVLRLVSAILMETSEEWPTGKA